MLTNLGYYGPKANTHLTASILFAQFFMPFTPYFVATGPKPKRTMDPEEEQYLGRGFKRIWRSSEGMRGMGELLSRVLGKQQLMQIELSSSSSFSHLKTS